MSRPINLFLFSLISFFTFLPSSLRAEDDYSYNFTWLDQDKEVYVLQNRVYRKKMRLYIQLGGGVTGSGPYVDTAVLQGRAGIFIWEDWGLEFLYSQARNSVNEVAGSVRDQGTVPFTRQIENYYGALLLWSPFYAKINTFNKILYMDVIFGLGAVKLQDKNNRNEFFLSSDKSLKDEEHAGIAWDVGFRVYLTRSFTVRIDVMGIHYRAEFPDPSFIAQGQESPDVRFNNYDYILSLGYVF